MLSPEQAREKVEHLVELARRAGADGADALYLGERSSAVQVRKGDLEDVHRSESEGVGLRVFRGSKSASASSSDLSTEALAALVERSLAMAAEAPDDPFAGLAPSDMLSKPPFADFDSWDPVEPDPANLKDRALIAEKAALAIKGVTNSGGATSTASGSTVALAISSGFSGAYRATGHSCSASVVAGEGSGMERDYSWHSARHAGDLEQAEDIGRRAGERAVARLNPVKFGAGRLPVLFEPRVATSLLGHFIAAIQGSSVARKSSFLQGKLGAQIFAPGIAIHDDPLRKRGLRSRAFDGEGLPVRPMDLVEDGVLKTWLAESASARQLGIAPTGHAIRGVGGSPSAGPSNLYLSAGSADPEQLTNRFPRCILVTELIGQGVNGVTGDYSRGAAGFLIEHGEIVGPVAEITIASNLIDMFASLEPANDLIFRRGVDSPTVLVPEMTVASA
ncbi:MAG: metallopeptidase TldD-related protein [Sphingomicrobium sp.]